MIIESRLLPMFSAQYAIVVMPPKSVAVAKMGCAMTAGVLVAKPTHPGVDSRAPFPIARTV